MKHQAKSIRTFIGSKNFEESKAFYRDLDFEEFTISKDMSYFKVVDTLGFYLQNYYVQDWVDNSMIFLEVDNVETYWANLKEIQLPQKYTNIKLSGIKEEDWGKEFFLHDPSGVLWHFGEFKKQPLSKGENEYLYFRES